MVDLLALAHERACEADLAERLDVDLDAGRLPISEVTRTLLAGGRCRARHCGLLCAASAYEDLARTPQGEVALKKPEPIDAGRLTLALNDLRTGHQDDLADLAARADKEGWPAARFLAALAEHEMAERASRRIRRHLDEARLPPASPRQLRLRGGADDQQGSGDGAVPAIAGWKRPPIS